MGPLLISHVWLLRATLLALPVLFILALPALAQVVRRAPRQGIVGLAVTLVAGLALRLLLGLWSVNHENGIAWVILEDAAALDRFPTYGLGGHVLYNFALAVGGGTPGAVFGLNAVLGALTPAALFLFALGLLRDWRAAPLAAALLAFNPAHIRLSASESLHIPMLLFAALGLAALVATLSVEGEPGGRAGRRARRACTWLAVTALALATQSRPLAALLALPAALLLATHGGAVRRWFGQRATWLALGAGAALTVPHAVHVAGQLVSGGSSFGFFMLAPETVLPRLVVPAQHAFVDPVVTPAGLQCAAGVGLLALLWKRRLAAIVLLPTLAAVVYTHTTHGENPIDQLRFHMGTLPWWCLVGGAALLPLSELGARRRWALAAATLLLAASGPALQRSVLTERWDQHRELAFWQRALPELPDEMALVHLDHRAAGGVITTAVPYGWWGTAGKLASATTAEALLKGREPLPVGAIWYRSPSCWYFDEANDLGRRGGEALDEPAPVPPVPWVGSRLLRPLCAAIEDRYVLEPIVEEAFTPQPARFVAPAARMTIGFYRVGE